MMFIRFLTFVMVFANVWSLKLQVSDPSPVHFRNISACKATKVGDYNPIDFDCCPPPELHLPTDFEAFNFEDIAELPMRVRPAAHMVDEEYIAKYTRAYELLRALPDTDPRKFWNQANLHCSYCNGGFYLDKEGKNKLEIHSSWLFLPWHRWFLFFHERMLAKLIDDDTFALPFWNWDNQDPNLTPLANSIPEMYLRNGSSLVDQLRDARHMPPNMVFLPYHNGSNYQSVLSHSQQREQNNALLYQHIVSGPKTPSLLLGSPFRPEAVVSESNQGSIENGPHAPVHDWTGNGKLYNLEDMGTLYSAARDPIFFAHHGNLDRLWNVWKTLGGRRGDLKDHAWLDSSLLFYNENAKLVSVKVGDAVDTDRLKYTYQETVNAWINAKPAIRASGGIKLFSGEVEEFREVSDGMFLENTYRSRVRRPLRSSPEFAELKSKLNEGEIVEEVLVIKVEIEGHKATKFDVFIDMPEANQDTPINDIEFAGTFASMPQLGGKRVTSFRMGISDKLELLGLEEARDVVVTIVRKGSGPVIVKGVKIEYE